jgi:hypothetical protein
VVADNRQDLVAVTHHVLPCQQFSERGIGRQAVEDLGEARLQLLKRIGEDCLGGLMGGLLERLDTLTPRLEFRDFLVGGLKGAGRLIGLVGEARDLGAGGLVNRAIQLAQTGQESRERRVERVDI